jgi:hypothetical protein
MSLPPHAHTQHQLQQGALEESFSLLLHHLPGITTSSPHLSQACTQPWLSLLVAAAAAGAAPLQQQVAEVMQQCAEGQQQHIDMAWVSAVGCVGRVWVHDDSRWPSYCSPGECR